MLLEISVPVVFSFPQVGQSQWCGKQEFQAGTRCFAFRSKGWVCPEFV